MERGGTGVMTRDECHDELRRRMHATIAAVKAGNAHEATVQRIAMYAALSARNAASLGGAIALELLDDQKFHRKW